MNSNSTPVSITSDEVDNFRRSLSQLQTPSAIERVVDWMEINENDSLMCTESEMQNVDNLGTFFRCDYKINNAGSQVKNDDENLTSVFNKSVPLCESPNSIESKSTCETHVKSDHQQNTDEKNELVITYQSKINKYHFIPPLNVESKKKELCSYLKLMTRGYKKEVLSSQCRRSTRVQNLERNKKIPSNHLRYEDACSDKSTKTNKSKISDRVESIALQSFEDLNMIVDVSKYPSLKENMDGKIFNFVMPPDSVLREFNDFKHWIEPIVSGHNNKNGTVNIEHTKNSNDSNLLNNHRNKRRELNKFRKRIKENIISSENLCEARQESTELNKTKEEFKYSTINNEVNNSISKLGNGNNCIILLHDEILVNESREDFEQALPNIEGKKMNDSELNESESMKIRIDYESICPNDKDLKYQKIPLGRDSVDSSKVQTPYFRGFPKGDIEKSEALLSDLFFCTDFIKNVPNNKESQKPVCRKSSIEKVMSDIKSNSIEIEGEREEIQSNTGSTSGSSTHSEDSSTSDSTSSEKSLKKQPIPNCEIISPSQITQRCVDVEPFSERSDVQSLHDLLKNKVKKCSISMNPVHDWDSDNSMNGKHKFSTTKNNSHFISFSKENGSIQNAVYVDFHLILVQELAVSMWNQTALGNVLGAQNLWIFNGETKKLILNKECVRKKSLEMTISMDSCVAYVELWTKEHKSDIRQGPVADVFAIVYFWFQKLNKIDKKVHQLENINGFSDDVQYVVLKSSLNIIVSWHSVVDDIKITQVRVYTLAPDFQKVVNVRAMSKVEHYVSSLHNIEDCEDLLLGCGEHTITLWNIEYGYIVASIKLNDIKLSLSTLWAKCDRGILFTVEQCVDKELRLIALNGRSQSWKKLKSYKPPDGFERIQHVYIENGVLISFYEEGILCWKAQTTEQILEENHETDMKYFPSGKYVIMTTEKNVFIRHALTHLLTAD